MNMLKKHHQEFFKTLGNSQRIEIMLSLLNKSLSVNEIVEATGFKQSAISHNLKRLEQCKFVHVNQNGKQRIYSVNKETISPLFDLIKKHAEKYCKHFCN